jgi:acetolactate synthase-1/2/3 large subunit
MQAQRPLVMLGAAASRPRSSSDLGDFVLRTRIPYFTTQMGKGTVPGGSELYMGTAALSERDYVHEAIERADLIITRSRYGREAAFYYGSRWTAGHSHIGYQPAHVEQVYFPQTEVIGDLGSSLRLLADRCQRADRISS